MAQTTQHARSNQGHTTSRVVDYCADPSFSGSGRYWSTLRSTYALVRDDRRAGEQ